MGKQLILALLCSSFSCLTLANDIIGIWKNIDDKTGSAKAIIEIRQESNGSYTGKVIKITPRPGYTPRETCIDCPLPYKNKAILGLDVLTDLKKVDDNLYTSGQILDPLTGKIYSTKAKLSTNGKRLTLRGYLGVSALGRNQIWIRQD